MSGIGFTLLGTDGAARRGRVATAHGTIETPACPSVSEGATARRWWRNRESIITFPTNRMRSAAIPSRSRLRAALRSVV